MTFIYDDIMHDLELFTY